MVMRIFTTLAGFAAFAAGLYYFTQGAKSAEEGQRVMTAFGPAGAAAVEMEVCITDQMLARERMGRGTPWPDAIAWADGHIQVVDGSGTNLSWRRRGQATHTTGYIVGIAESFMLYDLKPGATYTLKYTPRVADGVTYTAEFTAPTAAEKSQEHLELKQL